MQISAKSVSTTFVAYCSSSPIYWEYKYALFEIEVKLNPQDLEEHLFSLDFDLIHKYKCRDLFYNKNIFQIL